MYDVDRTSGADWLNYCWWWWLSPCVKRCDVFCWVVLAAQLLNSLDKLCLCCFRAAVVAAGFYSLGSAEPFEKVDGVWHLLVLKRHLCVGVLSPELVDSAAHFVSLTANGVIW